MLKLKRFLNQRYLEFFLVVFLAVISLKPVLFTWNLIQANFYLKKDPCEAGAYMTRALVYKPPVYRIFNTYAPGVIENWLVKSAIHRQDKTFFRAYAHLVPLEGLEARFRDNFYWQYLLGQIDQKRDWQYLDPVSLDLLADPRMNSLTQVILEKIAASFDQDFTRNLADFAGWKGNEPLRQYLTSTSPVQPLSFDSTQLSGCNYRESLAGLKSMLRVNFQLKAGEIGENLLPCPGFSQPKCREKSWYFSNLASNAHFGRGAFIMGLDTTGKDNNPVIRLMGFYAGSEPGKAKPRAGVRSRQTLLAENGFYVFGFDYFTVSGGECPSFWLCNGVEKQLPPTQRKWKKVLFILNNAFNRYDVLNPLIRLWGTGTMLVDNVFLAKVTTSVFSIPGPEVLMIRDSQAVH
jgi:hypothetical protein